MKPDTRTAMRALIEEARSRVPFDDPQAQECPDQCQGCSPKLLAFLDTELEEWERRLANGETPSFGDLHRLGNTCKKVHAVLRENGVVT